MKDYKLLKHEAINQAKHDFDELLIKMSQDESIKCTEDADLYLQKKYFYYEEMMKSLSFINNIKEISADEFHNRQMKLQNQKVR